MNLNRLLADAAVSRPTRGMTDFSPGRRASTPAQRRRLVARCLAARTGAYHGDFCRAARRRARRRIRRCSSISATARSLVARGSRSLAMTGADDGSELPDERDRDRARRLPTERSDRTAAAASSSYFAEHAPRDAAAAQCGWRISKSGWRVLTREVSDDGDGRVRRRRARHCILQSRRLLRSRPTKCRAGTPAVLPPLPAGCAAESAGPRPVDHDARTSAHGASGGESHVADAVRRRASCGRRPISARKASIRGIPSCSIGWPWIFVESGWDVKRMVRQDRDCRRRIGRPRRRAPNCWPRIRTIGCSRAGRGFGCRRS